MPDREIIKYCGTLGEFFAMTTHMPRDTPIYAATDGTAVTLHVGQPGRDERTSVADGAMVEEACA